MIQSKIVEKYVEVLHLFPLFHKFFETTKPNYTEEQFFQKLPWILEHGAIGYITDEGEPVAYGVIIEQDGFERIGMILQAYSEKPFMLGRLFKLADDWCNEKGIEKQVALVFPPIAETITKRYKMEGQFIYMVRDVNGRVLSESTVSTDDSKAG